MGPFAAPDVAEDVSNPILENVLDAAKISTEPSPLEALMQSVTDIIQDVKRWRCERADSRKKLRAAQDDEKQEVRDLLSGRRTLAAQALRKVMVKLHQDQAAEFRSQHSPPHPIPFDATCHIARLAPEDLDRRRYRNVHRATAMVENHEHDQIQLDHTTYRQAWCLARPRDAADIHKTIAHIVLRYPDDIRIDRRGNLLFARRNAVGSLVGFEIRQSQDLYADVRQPSGCGDGLFLIGSRSAKSYAIVPDLIAGLIRASACEAELELIAVAGRNMTPGSGQQLRDLKTGRIDGSEREAVLTNRSPTREAPQAFGDALGIDGNAVDLHNDDDTPAEQEIDDAPPSNRPTRFF